MVGGWWRRGFTTSSTGKGDQEVEISIDVTCTFSTFGNGGMHDIILKGWLDGSSKFLFLLFGFGQEIISLGRGGGVH
jgi:hypothetical protein